MKKPKFIAKIQFYFFLVPYFQKKESIQDIAESGKGAYKKVLSQKQGNSTAKR